MKLRTQSKNANKHTLHGMRLLEKSLQQDGWIGAQTATADGEMISGSARLEVAADKFADVEPIIVESDGTRPVVVVRTDIPSIDDPRAKRLSIADNQIAHTDLDFDGDLLKEWADEDKDIRAMFADSEWREITGEEKPVKDAEPQTDRAAELLEKWKVVTGDLWQIGEHRLICGDCTDPAVVARVMDGEKAGACVTDPPYGLGDNKSFNNDHPDYEDDKPFDLSLIDLSMPFAVFGGNYYETLPMARNKIGWFVWDKRPDLEGEKRERADRIFGQHFEIGVTNIGDLRGKMYRQRWGGFYGSQEIFHKTQKPPELFMWCIKQTEGVIIDYFLGSGTALLACQNLGRKCRAVEISPAYVAVALERMATAFPELEIKRLE